MLALSRASAASSAAANSGSRSLALPTGTAALDEGAAAVAAEDAAVKVLSSTVAKRRDDAARALFDGHGVTTHDETELADSRERRSVDEQRSIMVTLAAANILKTEAKNADAAPVAPAGLLVVAVQRLRERRRSMSMSLSGMMKRIAVAAVVIAKQTGAACQENYGRKRRCGGNKP
jgi:hypothetical protein